MLWTYASEVQDTFHAEEDSWMIPGSIRRSRSSSRKSTSCGNASRRETPAKTERRRLDELNVALDQCWDLLRQRRALREAGLDPEAAAARPPEVVERYQQ